MPHDDPQYVIASLSNSNKEKDKISIELNEIIAKNLELNTEIKKLNEVKSDLDNESLLLKEKNISFESDYSNVYEELEKVKVSLKSEIINKEAINKEYDLCKTNLENLNKLYSECNKELTECTENLEKQINKNNEIESKLDMEKQELNNRIEELLLSEEELNNKINELIINEEELNNNLNV